MFIFIKFKIKRLSDLNINYKTVLSSVELLFFDSNKVLFEAVLVEQVKIKFV